jgi:hypothetical protein|tara:strand:- start:10 stop:618 length:609 start_codon:yes stop_codon:yes gene_type:complete
MWAKVKADQVIEVFSGAKAITDSNGVQHPSSIFSNWSKDELKNIGVYAVSMATPPDSRFYKGGTSSYSFSNGKVIETINQTSHNLTDVTATDSDNKVMKNSDGTTMLTRGLITQYKMDIDNRAYSLLQPSDWMAVRQYETGVSITDDWKTYRAGVRTKAAEMKTAVSAVTSIGALKDLHVVYDTDNSIASGILYNFGEPPSE